MHQSFEWQTLVGIVAQRLFGNLIKQVNERNVAIHKITTYQGVDEESNQRFSLQLAPIRNRCSYNDVLLPGVIAEPNIDDRQQYHKVCGTLMAAKLSQCL